MKQYFISWNGEELSENKKSDQKKGNYQVQSVNRALQILTCFTLAKQTLSLIEICEMTGLPKPTVFRLLSTLENAQFISRTADQQKYLIGIRLFELGNIFRANLSIERIVSPFMQQITQKFDIGCNLAILDDGQVVYIESTSPEGPFQYTPIIGYRHYIHCSALGKSLVVDSNDTDIRDMLDRRGMPALSEFTITDPDVYIDQINEVREQGFALDEEEGAIGLYCMAVPIRNRQGKVAAALSVSGPSAQYTEKIKVSLIAELIHTAADIAIQL